jgi:lipoprotein-anchoring transpeptidase ErfK/SrfK
VTTVPSPLAPVQLEQRRLNNSAPLPAGGWAVGGVRLTFHVQATGADSLVPEVAIASADQPLSGSPTLTGSPIGSNEGSVVADVVARDLAPGQYHWQARFRNPATGAIGPWSPFSANSADFGLVHGTPTIASLQLTGAHVTSDGSLSVGGSDQPALHWTVGSNPPAALDHLVYVADHQLAAGSQPPTDGRAVPATTSSLDLSDLGDGAWSLHLWALDQAGQISAPATIEVAVAKTLPQISNVIFRSWATNPAYQKVPIRFEVSRPVSVTVTIMPAATTDVVRTFAANGTTIDLAWDGKDTQGKIVGVGGYRFLINATDATGNTAQAMYTGLQISDKVIQITLSTQSVSAIAGGQVFLKSLVTSGGQRLPTPTGTFEIQEKSAPFVFHSPFPKGSPYWYPDVTSHEAMLFDPVGANFIHDAPWRSIFGPGTNGPGIPGDTYDGSHGCVELPSGAMGQLYPWTPLGTPVVITS